MKDYIYEFSGRYYADIPALKGDPVITVFDQKKWKKVFSAHLSVLKVKTR